MPASTRERGQLGQTLGLSGANALRDPSGSASPHPSGPGTSGPRPPGGSARDRRLARPSREPPAVSRCRTPVCLSKIRLDRGVPDSVRDLRLVRVDLSRPTKVHVAIDVATPRCRQGPSSRRRAEDIAERAGPPLLRQCAEDPLHLLLRFLRLRALGRAAHSLPTQWIGPVEKEGKGC